MSAHAASERVSDATRDARLEPRTPGRAGPSNTPEVIRAAWDRIAPAFDSVMTPLNLPLGEEAMERVGIVPGTRFLDVAAGSGALSLPAARRGAHVLATDLSPVMVERLLARARAERLVHVEARTMDGHALQLPDDSFDVSGSMNGVSLFPDFVRGLAEMVRVTRSGGRVLIMNFAPLQHLEFLTFFMGAMQAAVPGFRGLPVDPPPLPFQVADPEILRLRLLHADLADVVVEQVTMQVEFESGRHLWEAVTSSNPIGAALVADLTDAQRDDVRHLLDAMLRDRSGSAGGVLRNTINIAIGRK